MSLIVQHERSRCTEFSTRSCSRQTRPNNRSGGSCSGSSSVSFYSVPCFETLMPFTEFEICRHFLLRSTTNMLIIVELEKLPTRRVQVSSHARFSAAESCFIMSVSLSIICDIRCDVFISCVFSCLHRGPILFSYLSAALLRWAFQLGVYNVNAN